MRQISDIAKGLGFEAEGDLSASRSTRPAHPKRGRTRRTLALAMDPKFLGGPQRRGGGARRARGDDAVGDADWRALGLDAAILAPRAALRALAGVTALCSSILSQRRPAWHEQRSVVIADEAEIDRRAPHIGPLRLGRRGRARALARARGFWVNADRGSRTRRSARMALVISPRRARWRRVCASATRVDHSRERGDRRRRFLVRHARARQPSRAAQARPVRGRRRAWRGEHRGWCADRTRSAP